MKILLFITSFGAGGAERSTLELGRYLRGEGCDVVFASLKRRDIGVEQELLDEKFDVYYCESLSLAGRIRFLVALIRKHRPDIVHSVLFDANLVARLSHPFVRGVRFLESLVNTPYVPERRGDPRLSRKKLLVVKLVDALSARLFKSYYHALTESVLTHYRPLFGFGNRRTFVIPRGRRKNVVVSDATQRASQSRQFHLVSTGRHEFQKGQILILQAMQFLSTERKVAEISLTILGREGECTPQLNAYIDENGLRDRVELAGFRTDVERHLFEADAFVFPSYFEGQGGALIEAFAAGLPCVCSDLPVLREVVGSPDGALFFATGNYRELAAAIEKLYVSPELRMRLSEQSLRRYDETFRIEKISADMKAMYEKILSDAD